MGKRLCVILAALLLVVSLGGCGGSSSTENSSVSPAQEGAYDTAAIYEEAGEAAEAADGGASANVEVDENVASDRKLIKNVNLEVETEEYASLVSSITERVEALGGYVERYDSYNENSIGDRSANLTLRIPAENLDSFVDQVAEISNIISRQESVEDVTLTYVDLESHKKMLEEEQERLLALLEQAETLEDILAIESRLTEVRYQLESMEEQLRSLDNQVSYSTVWLNVYEVEHYTPPAEKGTWERIQTGFMENVYKVGNGLREFFINFVISLPVLLVLAVIVAVVLLLIRLFVKFAEKRNAKRQAERNRSGQYPPYPRPGMQIQPPYPPQGFAGGNGQQQPLRGNGQQDLAEEKQQKSEENK